MTGKCFRTVFAVLFAAFFALTSASAQTDKNEGVKNAQALELQISSLPEAKLRFTESFIFPFLAGSGPLTKDNNITTTLGFEVTPISVSGSGELVWTPAAFFLLSGGGRAGSGWNIFLGDGTGINAPDGDQPAAPGTPSRAVISGSAFDGLVWNLWGAGTLQFDLGALIPGDWTHVLFQTRQELRYAAYTQAAPGDSWIFENDEGENQNGWNYYATYVLGYNMPRSPVLNTIALMAELKLPLYAREEKFWGGDLGRWIFSGLFNFSITSRFSTALAIQMRTRRNYKGGYNMYNEDYYYKELELHTDERRRHLLFYRVAAIMTYKF